MELAAWPALTQRAAKPGELVKTLVIIPTQKEFAFFRTSCLAQGIRTENAAIGRLAAVDLPDLDLTLALGGLGKVQFGIQTQHMLDAGAAWGFVICAGAAGALVDRLTIGDVVVATETVEHDIKKAKSPPLPRFKNAAIPRADFSSRSSRANSFQVHFGPITSGDEDVMDDARKKDLHTLTGALAVAWEGAGGARACQFSNMPFVEIRGITDGANHAAASDFKANLERVMSNVATVITDWARGRISGERDDLRGQ